MSFCHIQHKQGKYKHIFHKHNRQWNGNLLIWVLAGIEASETFIPTIIIFIMNWIYPPNGPYKYFWQNSNCEKNWIHSELQVSRDLTQFWNSILVRTHLSLCASTEQECNANNCACKVQSRRNTQAHFIDKAEYSKSRQGNQALKKRGKAEMKGVLRYLLLFCICLYRFRMSWYTWLKAIEFCRMKQ